MKFRPGDRVRISNALSVCYDRLATVCGYSSDDVTVWIDIDEYAQDDFWLFDEDELVSFGSER
jgi:hypothetical protein